MKKDCCVIIPAVKKNVAFPDDLIKKLDGVSLIQRAINTAKEIISPDNIIVATDSQEISLICERNGVAFNYKPDLKLTVANIIANLRYFLLRIIKKYNNLLILYPYSPLLKPSKIRLACKIFSENNYDLLVSVKKEAYRRFDLKNNNLSEIIFEDNHNTHVTLTKAFLLIKSDLIKEMRHPLKIYPYQLDDSHIEIENYQDWWVCDKLLRRKRIIFRVIGDIRVGMGHIYRALALGHEITDHEIIFVCDKKSKFAVNKIAGSDYLIYFFSEEDIESGIISLEPDLVVNDMLDTSRSYIQKLKQYGIRVMSFEDLGTGASYTDLTINELYDNPITQGNNILWGNKFFFLRDEFIDAKKRTFDQKVTAILITFGGTDQQNLTMKALSSSLDFCKSNNIYIHIVTGPGYIYKNELADFIDSSEYARIDFTFSTGVISRIMEGCDLAITSNGRTVYELCHMNIPSIIISQHTRESTHHFACEENGFINLGCYEAGITEGKLIKGLEKLFFDISYRKMLFERLALYDFNQNKSKVTTLIEKLLDCPN